MLTFFLYSSNPSLGTLKTDKQTNLKTNEQYFNLIQTTLQICYSMTSYGFAPSPKLVYLQDSNCYVKLSSSLETLSQSIDKMITPEPKGKRNTAVRSFSITTAKLRMFLTSSSNVSPRFSFIKTRSKSNTTKAGKILEHSRSRHEEVTAESFGVAEK